MAVESLRRSSVTAKTTLPSPNVALRPPEQAGALALKADAFTVRITSDEEAGPAESTCNDAPPRTSV